jgi:hypothetical protein
LCHDFRFISPKALPAGSHQRPGSAPVGHGYRQCTYRTPLSHFSKKKKLR